MYLPFRPKESVGRKGRYIVYLPFSLVPREGLYQIHGQSLNTHRGKHRSGGSQDHQSPPKRGRKIGAAQKLSKSVEIVCVGTGKRGHFERGLFTGGTSKISKFSRVSRKWSDSPLFSTVWRFSKISRISKLFRK